MAQQPNAILAINSLDRYISGTVDVNSVFLAQWEAGSLQLTLVEGMPKVGARLYETVGILNETQIVSVVGEGFGAIITIDLATTIAEPIGAGVNQVITVSAASQPVSNSLFALFNNTPPYSNNFTIQSPGALIYGYITKIIVSQIQLQYNIPTITTRNSRFAVKKAGQANISYIDIPYGFYYPDELAALLQVQMRADAYLASLTISVVYSDRSGFTFTATTGAPTGFFFPAIPELQRVLQVSQRDEELPIILKTYRTLGITIFNSDPPERVQVSTEAPNFLYTPYIDITSDVLTNYQKVKDTTTSTNKLTSLIARVYLSGSGQIQTTTGTIALGCRPFEVVADLNTPKVIRWDPSVAVPSIDFQLRDQYGDLIVSSEEVIDPLNPPFLTGEASNTEFQMTLLCIEGE